MRSGSRAAAVRRARPEESLPLVVALGTLFLFLFGTFSWSLLEPPRDPFSEETPSFELALRITGKTRFRPDPPVWQVPEKKEPVVEPAEPIVEVAVLDPAPPSPSGVPAPAAVSWVPGAKWIHPLPGARLSSDFGPRRRRYHSGIDLAAPRGTKILASRDGVVAYAGWRARYGRLVEIDHGNGFTSRYGHCSAILVGAGEPVKAGTVIAEVGSTGRSTGNHLHFEIRREGHALSPGPILAHSGTSAPAL